MKRFLIVALLSSVVLPGHATQLHLTGALEVYGAGGISDKFEKDVRDTVDAFNSVGVPASGSTKTNAGYGVRVGIILPRPNDFELGGSIGVVVGPRIVQKVTNGPFTYIPTGQTFTTNGETDVTTDTTFIRFLIEGAKKFPISQTSFIRLGIGAGGATAGVKQAIRTGGSISAVLGDSDTSEHWSGFTWEISPSIVFPLGTAELEAGLRYSQFPTKKESNDINKIEWTPLSVFIGVRFN